MSILKTFSNGGIRGDFTGTLPVISELHHLGHRGVVFALSAKVVIPANSSLWLTGETDGSSVHWSQVQFISDEGGIEVTFREDVVASGGSPLTPVCRNRRAPIKDSTFTIAAGPTVTDEGNELFLIGIPAASSPQARVAQSGDDEIEWVLASGKKYGLKFTNLTGSPRTLYGEFSWYESGLL